MSNHIRCRVAEVMHERNLSSRKLAAALGIHPNTVNSFLHGRRTPHRATVHLIATYLGLVLDQTNEDAA